MTCLLKEITWTCNLFINNFKWFTRNYKNGNSDSLACLSGKTAIVTGGNKGIGFATSVLLASRGCRVIIACRSDASAVKNNIIDITGNHKIEIKRLDLASFTSVREFADDIKRTESKIDILINNAGVGVTDQNVTEDELNPILQINFFSPFLLTHLLLDPLKASREARVVFISSHSVYLSHFNLDILEKKDFGSNIFSSYFLYAKTKLCVIIGGQMFAKKLAKYNIMVNVADPGFVKTAIYDKPLKDTNFVMAGLISFYLFIVSRDTFNGAQSSFHLASSEKLKNVNGELYLRCRKFRTPQICHDEEICKELWFKTEHIVHLLKEEVIIEDGSQ